MPLLRAQKEDLVTKITQELKDSRVALVFAYTALNMKANDTLRTNAFERGAKVKMLSNNLLALILKNVGREMDIPAKQLAIAYGFQDEVEAAKTLVAFAKETDTLEVLGGWIDGNFFDATQVKTLSSLPNKETLQAQLVGRLGGLIGGLVYSLNFPLQKFAYVIEAVKTAQPTEPIKAEEPVASTPAETPAPAEPTQIETEETPADAPAEAGESAAEEVKEEN